MKQRCNQRERILGLLKEREDEWIPLYEITSLAAQYSARIHELRAAGHQIENRTEHRDGQVLSWFRLAPQKGQQRLFNESQERPTYQGPRTPAKFLYSVPGSSS